MKTIELKKAELNQLPTIDATVKYLDFSVEHFFISNFNVKQFFIDLLKARGIKKPKIYDCNTYVFHDVGMHVDSLSPISASSIIIMIYGSGTLCITSKTEDKKSPYRCDDIFLERSSCANFDFHMPHSFKKDEKQKYACVAIVADVSRKQLEKIF